MKIHLTEDALSVVLEGKEKIWAVKKQLTVAADTISNVEWMTGTVNRSRLNGWRAPGTGVPKMFYAGSIYRKAGWEFWYLKAKQPGYLVITTDQKKYRVIRLTVSEDVGTKVREWFEDLMHERKK
ncbi:hypothetical protein KBD20_01965 [Candidatus Saccharibacteria bacterium]|nr:hypothetical protein [Candidatus Saccharibacteria bacterium]